MLQIWVSAISNRFLFDVRIFSFSSAVVWTLVLCAYLLIISCWASACYSARSIYLKTLLHVWWRAMARGHNKRQKRKHWHFVKQTVVIVFCYSIFFFLSIFFFVVFIQTIILCVVVVWLLLLHKPVSHCIPYIELINN